LRPSRWHCPGSSATDIHPADDEARRVAQFFAQVGLPVHLGQLSIDAGDASALDTIVAGVLAIALVLSIEHAQRVRMAMGGAAAPRPGETSEVDDRLQAALLAAAQANAAAKVAVHGPRPWTEPAPGDYRGSIDYANARWFRYTGTGPELDLARDWPRILHPDDLQASLEQYATEQGFTLQ